MITLNKFIQKLFEIIFIGQNKAVKKKRAQYICRKACAQFHEIIFTNYVWRALNYAILAYIKTVNTWLCIWYLTEKFEIYTVKEQHIRACMFIWLSYGRCCWVYANVCMYTHMHTDVGVSFSFIVYSYQWTASLPSIINTKTSPGFCVSKTKPLYQVIKVKIDWAHWK